MSLAVTREGVRTLPIRSIRAEDLAHESPTVEDIREQLKDRQSAVQGLLYEAILTLAALPDHERKYIYAKQASWPDVLHDFTEAYGWDHVRTRRPRPTPQAIDRMLPVLIWLTWLQKRQQRLIWSRAFDTSWWKLCSKLGRSERTVRRWHDDAIEQVERELRKRGLTLPEMPSINEKSQ